jgi:flagellar basal body-associated protein FliL
VTVYTDQTPNVRYGKITLLIYTALNVLLLVVICVGLWIFAARANSHGIPPNTHLGFRSQHTMASLHGWYVAQRVGFHFAAIADTVVTAVVFAILALVFVRRSNPIWILILPIIGGIAVGGCFVIAGHRADHAAISVETPKAEPMSLEFRAQSTGAGQRSVPS